VILQTIYRRVGPINFWNGIADQILLEEIQGDAYELFERTSQENLRKAKRQFIWNVVRFFRLKNIRRSKSTYSNNTLSMLKSYLLIGFRNM
jgi:putative ABC transport system permease protein